MEEQEKEAIMLLADKIIKHCDSSDGKAINQCAACKTCDQGTCEVLANIAKIKNFCRAD